MFDNIKYWWEDLPKYTKYGIVLVLLLIIGGNAWFFIFNHEQPQNTLSKIASKGDEIKTINNTNKTNLNAKGSIKDINNKTQKNTNKDNKDNKVVKEVAQATNDNTIRKELGLTGDNSVKYLSGKKIDLKNIKPNELLQLRNQIYNIDTLNKQILAKYRKDNIQRYNKLIKENIVKKYGVGKIFALDKSLINKHYPGYKSIVLTTVDNIVKISNDIGNYEFKEEKKCAKVFGKEQCTIKEYKFIKYKNGYINYGIVSDILRINKNKYYIILLGKNINGTIIYNDYKLFHKQYGWYGYKIINVLKIALDNNNYKIMYLYTKYKIDNLITGYKKDIIGKINKILNTNF